MIQTKRDSLEEFLRTQMEGPGACNNRFALLDNGEDSGSIAEVINTTPGSLYSTAILFPKRTQNIDNTAAQEGEEEGSISVDGADTVEAREESEQDNDLHEKNPALSQAEEDDLYSLSQRFPNTIGISCCLDAGKTSIDADDINITISGRYYTRISKGRRESILILIPEHYVEFREFFEEYQERLSLYFSLHPRGITSAGDLSGEYSQVKKSLLDINLDVCRRIALNATGKVDQVYQGIGNNYRYLKSYKERLWSRLKGVDSNGNIYLSEEDKFSIVDRMQKVELFETFLSYFDDVVNIYNTKFFGYWEAHNFSQEVDLSGIDFDVPEEKRIYSPKDCGSLRDVVSYDIDGSAHASLSVWLQITKDSRGENDSKRYLKVLLENTSDPFEENAKQYFSIVTEKVNQRSFFGVEIKVESAFLCPYHHSIGNNRLDDDVEQLNYLYRSIKDYGIGHLCSVDWVVDEHSKVVKSEFIPSFETPDVEPVPRNKYGEYIEEEGKLVPKRLLKDSKPLEFKWLSSFSDASNAEVIAKLYEFVDAYGDWAERLNTIADGNEFALHNIALCEQDYRRMRSNIELLLENSPENTASFRLMNSAMFIQLWHSKNSTSEKTDFSFYKRASDYIFGNFSASWRPFQIAFILLNLDGIFQRPDDPEWLRRNELVDLVWFPTGGGKTEAYLGIIALTIINRRTNKDAGRNGGTTVIMRYTLRLLAIQQFQRAMRVILALEQLRLWNPEQLGEEPISIGLYVGNESLPNKATDLLAECIKWSNITGNRREESKIPLDRCPWCGSFLQFQDIGNYSSPQIIFQCPNIRCTFTDCLPVKLCDDYIYDTPPTLLFGTVDKFASIGHKVSTDPREKNKDSRRIFGKGLLNNLPPELIIQDELHLLLGPLGSAVSLFESAVDQLCSYNERLGDGKEITVRPKIISSTATTRNTELQIRALYDRNVNIFPKSGIDYDDSFFAFFKREKINGEIKYISKRKYIGILPTGRTQMTTQMRLIATMFVHRALFEKQHVYDLSSEAVERAMDYYHSVIAYFNSLKEVGRTDAQFYTEFTKYTRRLFKRVLRNSNMLECYYGYDSSFSKSELTGRLSGSEVVDHLGKVAKRWNASQRLPYKNDDNEIWHRGYTPPDLILATNMISVGLDVDRFNTMVINSMPRNIAEYIQASSRIARNDLGLAVTLHNPFRSRDLSHFEKFREFHEKLYYYVEPISITPFSKKSVERYLPLYLATMIRHSYANLANQKDAGSLDAVQAERIKRELMEYFYARLKRTQRLDESQKELLTSELTSNIEEFITNAMQGWVAMANAQQSDGYSLRYSGSTYLNHNNRRGRITYKDLFLALDAYEDDKLGTLWAVPMALRTVESEAVINIKEQI